jgi:type II secretory pathway component PulK
MSPLIQVRVRSRSFRRAFATLLVFGVIVIAAVVVVMLQSTAFSQAAAGREALARVRAHWAARAGLEATIARLEFDTENPDSSDAFKVIDELASVGEGSFASATYRITSWDNGTEYPGPSDAHSRLNINLLTRDQLLLIEPLMTEDIADSILDWIDADDDVRELGAELGYYQSLPYPYEPRNAPFRSIQELELVAGVDIEDVRGEDWNLNGLLDPNENDGSDSWPPDNADNVLDAGWSGILTAASSEGSLSATGQERLDLTSADESDLADRISVTSSQAGAILDYVANNQNATMADFINRNLSRMGSQPPAENLTTEQLGLLLDEATIGPADAGAVLPGRLNINTCPAEVFEYLPEIQADVADAIIADRSGRPEGYTSIAQLLEVPGMTRRQLATVYPLLTVRSNVYSVTCRGRDTLTGLEVEVMATIDRSTLPVVVREVLVR